MESIITNSVEEEREDKIEQVESALSLSDLRAKGQ